MLRGDPPKPPKRKTAQQWADEQLAGGNLYAFDYTPEQLTAFKTSGKAPEFYNPKMFKRSTNGSLGTFDPLTETSGQDPYIKFTPSVDVVASKAPKPGIVEGRQPLQFGPNQTFDPNTGKYFDPISKQEIKPIIEQKKNGGLVKKYGIGGSVNRAGQTGQEAIDAMANQPAQTGLMGAQTQGLTSSLSGPLSALGNTTATAIQAGNTPNDQGEIDKGKAALSGGLRAASTVAPIAANPALLLATGGLSALAIPVAGGIGAIVGASRAGKQNEEAVQQFQINKNEEQQAADKLRVNDALRKRDIGMSKGGKVVGKGTATSDGIAAKVRADSFIVPAENAPIAKELKEKVLRKAPAKKADLKQSGGKSVKLSNGEYMFTPEEVSELKAKGIDVNALAPEAKTDLTEYLKCGGMVKNYAKGGAVSGKEDIGKFISEQKDRISERDAALKKMEAEYKADQQKAEGQRKFKKDVWDGIMAQMEENRSAKKELEEAESEFNALKDSYDTMTSQQESAMNKPTSASERAGVRSLSSPSVTSLKKDQEKILALMNKTKEKADSAKQRLDKASSLGNYLPKSATKPSSKPMDYGVGETKASAPTERENYVSTDGKNRPLTKTGEEISVTAPVGRTAPKRMPAQKMDVEPITDVPQLSLRELEGVGKKSYNEQMAEDFVPDANQYAPATALRTSASTPGATTTPPAQGGGGLSSMNGWQQALSYGIPAVQTAVGASALSKIGKRPVNHLDPEYLSAVSGAKDRAALASREAQYGFTPEEKFLLGQQNQGLLNQARYASQNLSGGSGVAGYNMLTKAIGDKYNRGLMTQVQDRALRLQKQSLAADRAQYADSLVTGKAQMNRRLFEDQMNAFQQNQGAAGNLTSQGLTNLVSQNRYNQFLNNREAYQ